MDIELDDRDHRLLDLLEADAWTTYAALAGCVNLSASAVQRRVERMIDCGIILGARAQLGARRRTRPLTVFLTVELVNDATATIRRFTRALAAAPEVIEAHYVTGEIDVLLKLQVADMVEYNAFIERHVNDSPLARRFKTFTSLRPLK